MYTTVKPPKNYTVVWFCSNQCLASSIFKPNMTFQSCYCLSRKLAKHNFILKYLACWYFSGSVRTMSITTYMIQYLCVTDSIRDEVTLVSFSANLYNKYLTNQISRIRDILLRVYVRPAADVESIHAAIITTSALSVYLAKLYIHQFK